MAFQYKERFLAHLEHFENPNAGEAGNNIRAAMKLCKDAGMHFTEVLQELFGTGNAAEIDELKRRLKERQDYADKISLAYDKAEIRIAELETQFVGRIERERGLRGLVVHAWGKPEFRLALLALVIDARLLLYALYENTWPRTANSVAAVLGLFLFFEFNALEYQDHGFVQLLMKWGLFIGGLVGVSMGFAGSWPMQNGPQPQWIWATFALLVLTLLTMSKFTRRLAQEVNALTKLLFEMPLLAAVKGWLV